jgi:molybdopterin converting factor subunit 1
MTPTPEPATIANASTRSAVNVLLFSVLRERVGASNLTVQISEGGTVSDLLDAICAEHPIVTRFRETLRVAVNAEYAASGDPVRPGDEIALITPVSGG